MRLSIPEIGKLAPRVGDTFRKDGKYYVVTHSGADRQDDPARNESWLEFVVEYQCIIPDGRVVGGKHTKFIFDANDLDEFVIIEHRQKDERWIPDSEYAF